MSFDLDSMRTFSIPASAMWGATVNGAAGPTVTHYGTNDVDLPHMAFDKDTEEYAFALVMMPDSYNGGTLTAGFCWTADASSGDLTWGIAATAYANDGALDAALGTGVVVTDTLTAVDDLCMTARTAVVTPAGAPAGGQLMLFRFHRKVLAGLAADGLLLSVLVEYQATTKD